MITTGITWCLAWGEQRQPQFDLSVLQQMRQALNEGTDVPEEVRSLVEQVQQLETLDFPNTLDELKQLTQQYPTLWNSQIGLIYGGATKIKQYVFEAAKLPDIRGASALLDRINLVDIPAFFGEPHSSPQISRWLNKNFPQLETALIKELLIYYKGGNILAFCPAAFVDDLANAIEKRYTEETLTANSCAVGSTFKLLELRYGLLKDSIEDTPWLEWYHRNHENSLVKAYFDQPDVDDLSKAFQNRKSFNELAGKLAALFNQRRNGNNFQDGRLTRRYPPMFETHPYLRRDESDRRAAIAPAKHLPGEPWLSDALARKRIVGQRSKGEGDRGQKWWTDKNSAWRWQVGQIKQIWNSGKLESWVVKFKNFLKETNLHNRYYQNVPEQKPDQTVKEARSLREIANASNLKGFVGYIYADGNNMGGYIQKEIKTPEDYKQFSEDIFEATENSVYEALAQHLKPHKLSNLNDADNQHQNGTWIHPFEIITIGGDDVLLIVPANKALAIAKTIGEEFEKQLLKPEKQRRYAADKDYTPKSVHRYQSQQLSGSNQCKLSMSTGVLITAEDTPIYYAEKLTTQLLKSAKKQAKLLKKEHDYCGGTVDFLVMKSVTMISSNIGDFRAQGLIKPGSGEQKLKLYAAPYTLHELGGLLETAKVLKEVNFPRSQLYQIRSFLEQGKNTAILNYRYFRTRLQEKKHQHKLKEQFEEAWCEAKTNNGNLAPWMTDIGSIIKNLMLLLFFETFPREQFRLQYVVLSFLRQLTYETIWRELVDLYPFIEDEESKTPSTSQQTAIERK